MPKLWPVILALALTATRIHAAETPIAAIVDDGEGYNHQAVVVSGAVFDPAYMYAGEGLYTLTDGERRITVVSKTPPPAVGTHVTLDATVGWHAGDEEFTWPPILLETSRSEIAETLLSRL